jgi:phosphoribosylaminoimidazolecarboxamide formyltransferase/IMP cyclohydrolase
LANKGDIQIKQALISAWEKEPAVRLAQGLEQIGVTIIASGGTAKAIEDAGVSVTKLETITGFAKLLNGRVKTLHTSVHAAILANRNNPDDMADLSRLNLAGIDLVAVDLYPFPNSIEENIVFPVELIDIGGVALIRGAAKNFDFVTTLSRAGQFGSALEYFIENKGIVSASYRRRLAGESFEYTSKYDSAIAKAFVA